MITLTLVVFALRNSSLIYLCRKNVETNHLALPELMLPSAIQLDQQIDQYLSALFPSTAFYRKQIRAFSSSAESLQEPSIRIGYYAMTLADSLKQASENEYGWMEYHQENQLDQLENEILQAAHRRLLSKMTSQLAGFELIPTNFTLKQLQEVYESILGHTLDKRNFRRKILRFEVIQETGKHLQPWHESGKAPMLYQLDRKAYDEFRQAGGTFNFS